MPSPWVVFLVFAALMGSAAVVVPKGDLILMAIYSLSAVSLVCMAIVSVVFAW